MLNTKLTGALALILALGLGACANTRDASIADASASRPIKLPIAQIDRGVAIWLPSQVMFDFGKASFNEAEAAPYLDKVARLLREKTQKTVALEGHTDNVGSGEFNQALSTRRAESVRDAMLARGVPAERMQVAGFGLARPVAPNDTEVGRAVNRRVEVVVLDEKIENITRDEPANSFESAFDKLKALFDTKEPLPAK
jgi:outer membrane protein OmpA-like peptidoglycan-associated protein